MNFILSVVLILLIVFIIFKYYGFVQIPFTKKSGYLNIDDKFNMAKMNKKDEIDRILDKIGENGVHSLSKGEIKTLDEYEK